MNCEVEFNRWLLAVGNGSRLNNSDFDDRMVEIPFNIVSHENAIVREIFGNSVAVNNDEELDLLSSKVILTPKNTDSLKINHEVLSLLPGGEIVCPALILYALMTKRQLLIIPLNFSIL